MTSQPWKRRVVLGDGRVVLYEADCLEILPHLEGVDAVVTDPPYGVDFKGKTYFKAGEKTGYTVLDNNLGPVVIAQCIGHAQRMVIFSGARLMFDYPKPYETGAVYCPAGAGNGRWGFTVWHPILFYGKATTRGRQTPNGFMFNAAAEPSDHPCAKPIKWMLWAVGKASYHGETILDPFMGSGTTGVAAVQLGRKFIGVEIEPKYFDIAVERITHALAQPRLFDDEPAPTQEALI